MIFNSYLSKWRIGPILKKYVVNTSWLALGSFLRLIVGLFIGVFVARYLGPEQYGMLSYVIAFVGLFSVLSSLGLNSIVVKELAKHPECRDEILGTAMALRAIGTLLMAGMIVTVSVLMHQTDMMQILIVIVFAGYFFQVLTVIDWYFQAEVLSRFVVIAQIAQLIVVALATLLMIWLDAPLVMFALVLIVEAMVLASVLVWFYTREVGKITLWSVSRIWATRLLKQSWPLILSGAAIMIQARIDQVMLGEMLGDNAVGQYSVAMRMIEAFAFVPVIICNSIAPEVTKWKLSGEKTYHHGLTNLYRLMFILFLIVAIPLFFLATPIIVFLFGESYQPAGALLALFGIRLFFVNFGMVRGLFVTNNELFRYALVTSLLGAVINVALNYMLIPDYGAEGAIWATILSFLVTVFFVDAFYSAARVNFMAMVQGILTPWKLSLRRI